ncbi:hypothetical protein L6452_13410 [Arctium lappa]|uniref:Uncharacterized protein n=1 Tax=Arctium lappa TaxID=4217 RepID=A0ACB9CI30_ARCLA|nr:hypothetical protein L6452_13410 [Arctium lappa]
MSEDCGEEKKLEAYEDESPMEQQRERQTAVGDRPEVSPEEEGIEETLNNDDIDLGKFPRVVIESPNLQPTLKEKGSPIPQIHGQSDSKEGQVEPNCSRSNREEFPTKNKEGPSGRKTDGDQREKSNNQTELNDMSEFNPKASRRKNMNNCRESSRLRRRENMAFGKSRVSFHHLKQMARGNSQKKDNQRKAINGADLKKKRKSRSQSGGGGVRYRSQQK